MNAVSMISSLVISLSCCAPTLCSGPQGCAAPILLSRCVLVNVQCPVSWVNLKHCSSRLDVNGSRSIQLQVTKVERHMEIGLIRNMGQHTSARGDLQVNPVGGNVHFDRAGDRICDWPRIVAIVERLTNRPDLV